MIAKVVTSYFIFTFLMYFICGIPYRDCTNAFKMFNKEILNKIKLKSKIGFTFALELTIKAHLNNFTMIRRRAAHGLGGFGRTTADGRRAQVCIGRATAALRARLPRGLLGCVW